MVGRKKLSNSGYQSHATNRSSLKAKKKLSLKYVEYEDLSADHITPISLMTNDETMLATDLFRTTISQPPTGTIIFHLEKILFKIN